MLTCTPRPQKGSGISEAAPCDQIQPVPTAPRRPRLRRCHCPVALRSSSRRTEVSIAAPACWLMLLFNARHHATGFEVCRIVVERAPAQAPCATIEPMTSGRVVASRNPGHTAAR